ncbi:sodium/potassium/calcium exchanger 3-like [Gigantopelta aegis]|uniref:sodium/potassium/calcium exchanger 3-like n=1 Tax=Gigantopelta aegis TaxID=1735272 RepID=UPI001B88AA12|nr:sodium/potassium/calcium exchanger 3-like [Gigantopelta aegis]
MRVMRLAVSSRAVIFTLVVTVPTLTRLFWNGTVKSTSSSSKTSLPVSDVPDDRRTLLERSENSWKTHFFSRHLLSKPNCTPRAVEQFPRDIFSQDQRSHGAILIHIFIVLYMFLALAIVCDSYFVPSLEILCEYLHLESDVAGATFMAAGSSAPELATAVIGVFIAKDDVGLGTIVGSAIYNVMFVISVCAMFAGTVVYLNWWPLIRDCVAYSISIAALVIVIFDEVVNWYEAVALCVLYMMYIVLMYFNSSLEDKLVPMVERCCPKKTREESIVLYEKVTSSNGAIDTRNTSNGQFRELQPLTMELGDESDSDDETFQQRSPTHSKASEEEPQPLCRPPSGFWKSLLWFVSLPINSVLFITVPDCRKTCWRRCFLITFFMSLVWLSAFSYFMVWMITVVGYTANIPDTIMGLTLVAFGVSLPDVVASLIVVRDGFGDMAVSNAVGSNVFDILICLGVPWLLQTSIISPGSHIQVYSEGLIYSSLTLLSTVVFLIVATHVNGWKLDKKFGVILMVVYILYTVLASMYELNIFGYFHPKECPSNY